GGRRGRGLRYVSLQKNSSLAEGPAGGSAAGRSCGRLSHGLSPEREGGRPVSDMKRRDLFALLGGAAAAWPLAARAQQPAMPLVGFLSSASPEAFAPYLDAFLLGLAQAGFVHSRNLP